MQHLISQSIEKLYYAPLPTNSEREERFRQIHTEVRIAHAGLHNLMAEALASAFPDSMESEPLELTR